MFSGVLLLPLAKEGIELSLLIINYLLLALSVVFQIGYHQFVHTELLAYSYLILVILFQVKWFYSEGTKTKHILDFTIIALFLFIQTLSSQLDVFLLLVTGLSFYNEETDFFFYTKWGITGLGILYTFLSLGLSITFYDAAIFLLSIILLHFYANEYKSRAMAEDLNRDHHIKEDEISKMHQSLLKQNEKAQAIHTLQERNRISREVHDSAGHTLSTLVIQLEAIEKLSEEAGNQQVSDMIMNLRTFAKAGLSEVREVVHAMKPEVYNRVGYMESIDQLVDTYQKNTGIDVFFGYNTPTFDLSDVQQDSLYRTIQESLANTAKYAKATTIRLRIFYTHDRLFLNIKDNGQGVDEIVPSVGLTGMKERIMLAGGSIDFISGPNRGFHTRVTLNRRDAYERD